MKKLYTAAALALASISMANAQALKIENNFVMKTCALLPEGTHPIVYTQDDGTESVKCPLQSKINGISDKVATAFLDDNYTSLPLSGGTAGGTNYHVLEQDYTDPETGVSFAKGAYSCLNTNTAICLYDTSNPQGMRNIKQVIFYLASGGQLQFYARQYEGTSTGTDYCHFEGDPTNRKLKQYYAPGFSTPLEGKAQWYEMHFTKPLKLVVDLTNATGTSDEMKNASVNVNLDFGTTDVVKALLQYYEKATDESGKTVQGSELIPWTADSKFAFQFKKKSYVMGIAIICGTDGAQTRTIDLSENEPQWSSPTGIQQVMTNAISPAMGKIYSIDGRFVGTDKESLSRGLYIQNGKKFVIR